MMAQTGQTAVFSINSIARESCTVSSVYCNYQKCTYLVVAHGAPNHTVSPEHPDGVHHLVSLYILLPAMRHPPPALFSLLPPSFSLFVQHPPPKQH